MSESLESTNRIRLAVAALLLYGLVSCATSPPTTVQTVDARTPPEYPLQRLEPRAVPVDDSWVIASPALHDDAPLRLALTQPKQRVFTVGRRKLAAVRLPDARSARPVTALAANAPNIDIVLPTPPPIDAELAEWGSDPAWPSAWPVLRAAETSSVANPPLDAASRRGRETDTANARRQALAPADRTALSEGVSGPTGRRASTSNLVDVQDPPSAEAVDPADAPPETDAVAGAASRASIPPLVPVRPGPEGPVPSARPSDAAGVEDVAANPGTSAAPAAPVEPPTPNRANTPSAPLERNAPNTPKSPTAEPADHAQAEGVTRNRGVANDVSVRTTQDELTVLLPGTGWVYLGSDNDATPRFIRKDITDDGSTRFVFRTPSPGDYGLIFQMQDLSTGSVDERLVRLEPGDFAIESGSDPPETESAPTASANAAEGENNDPLDVDAPGVEDGRAADGGGTEAVSPSGSTGERAAAPSIDPGLEAIVTLSLDQALEEAARAENQGAVAGAIDLLERYLASRDVDTGFDELYFTLASLYEQPSPRRDMRKARGYYRRVVDEYPFSTWWDASQARSEYITRHFFQIR